MPFVTWENCLLFPYFESFKYHDGCWMSSPCFCSCISLIYSLHSYKSDPKPLVKLSHIYTEPLKMHPYFTWWKPFILEGITWSSPCPTFSSENMYSINVSSQSLQCVRRKILAIAGSKQTQFCPRASEFASVPTFTVRFLRFLLRCHLLNAPLPQNTVWEF